MLTDKEKDHIRQEEIYRHEVQQALTEKKPKEKSGGSLWAFLNSAFGLWLLSTLAVSMITWGFSKLQEDRANELANRDAFQHLNTEIGARIHQLSVLAKDLGKNATPDAEGKYNVHVDVPIYDMWAYLGRPPSDTQIGPIINVYPEYKDLTTLQLFYELEAVSPDDQKAEIIQAQTALQGLYDTVSMYMNASGSTVSEAELQSLEAEVNEVFFSDRLPERWSSP
jgi:hypothetical protein